MTNDLDSVDESGPQEGDWKGELRELYDAVDREVAAIGPVCELSGRCCRFLEYGHTLFISTAEVNYLLGSARAAGSAARLGRDLPVARFARALHRARRPAAGLPDLLLRPLIPGRMPTRFRSGLSIA